MINPSKMLKTCQDFNWRTSIQRLQSQHFPQHQLRNLRTRERLLRPSTTLCSPPLPLAERQEQHKPQLLDLGQTGREEQRWREPRMVEQLEKGQQISLEPGYESAITTRGSFSHFWQQPVILPKAAGGQQVTV